MDEMKPRGDLNETIKIVSAAANWHHEVGIFLCEKCGNEFDFSVMNRLKMLFLKPKCPKCKSRKTCFLGMRA